MDQKRFGQTTYSTQKAGAHQWGELQHKNVDSLDFIAELEATLKRKMLIRTPKTT